MKYYNWELISVLLAVAIIACSSAQHHSYEKTAYDSLKLPEHKCCTPIANSSHKLEVKYGIGLIDVASFDPKTGVAEFIIWERMSWTDFRLTWDTSAHSGVKVLRINPEELWTPDIRAYKFQESKLDRGHTKTVLYNNGHILWIPTSRLKKRCIFLDDNKVHCSFKVGSWTYDGNTLDIGFYEDMKKMDVSDFAKYKGQFEIVENVAKKNVVYYPCCAEPYPHLMFNLTLRYDEDMYSSAVSLKAIPLLFVIIMAMHWIV